MRFFRAFPRFLRWQVCWRATELRRRSGRLACDARLPWPAAGWCGSRELLAGGVALLCMAPLVAPKRLASTKGKSLGRERAFSTDCMTCCTLTQIQRRSCQTLAHCPCHVDV